MSRTITFTLACLAGIFFCTAASASSGTAGVTKWEVTSPFNLIPSAGFVPVTLSATNHGPRETTAKYEFENSFGYYNGSTVLVAAGSMKLPPKKAVVVTHWIWRGSQYQDEYGQNLLRFNIDTPAGSSSDTLNGGRSAGARVAISRDLRGSGGVGRYGMSSKEERVVTFSPKELPADWRVFSSLQGIILRTSDWDELSPGVRDAMRTWVGLGGKVRIVDTNIDLANAAVAQLLPSDEFLGVFAPDGAVKAIRESQAESQITSLLRKNNLALALGAPESDGRKEYNNYYYDDDNNQQRRDAFPLRDEFGRRDIPYFFVCMLLIVFAVLVGPVALRVWAGPGRRHRLFFTTPVLSLTASGLMLVIMLFQDGLGLDGRRFVLLDLAPVGSSQPNAIVYQEQFSRAGMIGTRGFDLEEGLIPVIPSDAIEDGLGVRDGRATGEWFSSRRDRSMVLVGSVPVRWGVTLESVSEEQITLRFESPLTDFEEAWFVDGDGQWWTLNRNSPGTEGTLNFISAGRGTTSLLRDLFTRCSVDFKKSVLARADQTNQRNRFWALVKDGEEAARATDPKINWKESNLVITSKVIPKS